MTDEDDMADDDKSIRPHGAEERGVDLILSAQRLLDLASIQLAASTRADTTALMDDVAVTQRRLWTTVYALWPSGAARMCEPMTPMPHLHTQIMEMTAVLIDALGTEAVDLKEWLEDPDRFELWEGTSGGEEYRGEQSKALEGIAMAFGFLSAVAASQSLSIAEVVDLHRRFEGVRAQGSSS